MDLKVEASGRSKTHYGPELSPDFWLQGAFLHLCNVFLILYSDKVFVSLCPFHKLWEILKEMGIPDHLTCLLRNPYAGQEATVRTGHGTTDWFQTGKGVPQGCILSPCLLNLYAECRGPASAGSRGYPQDERHRRKRERRHVRPALIGPSLCFTFWQPVLYPFTECFQGTRCLLMITQD